MNNLMPVVILKIVDYNERTFPGFVMDKDRLLEQLFQSSDLEFLIEVELQSMLDRGVIHIDPGTKGYKIGSGSSSSTIECLVTEIRVLMDLLIRRLGETHGS